MPSPRCCPEGVGKSPIIAAFLELAPPKVEVELALGPQGEGSSWSCAHGVGRWKENCGCETGGQPAGISSGGHPLRESFDFLNEKLAGIFDAPGQQLPQRSLAGPQRLCGRHPRPQRRIPDAFFASHAVGNLSPDDQIQVLKLLEMERHVLLMYTSCGWFFSDLAGLETLQVLKYAARALQLGQQFSHGRFGDAIPEHPQ